MTFIKDDAERDSIRNDISSAFNSFHNGEWKASTVLAGSALEALLLWLINAHSGKLGSLGTKPNGTPEEWSLVDYISVAEQLKLISKETATQARQAKNFRNLIHPGRAQRVVAVCDKAPSLAALSAVEFAIRDLQ